MRAFAWLTATVLVVIVVGLGVLAPAWRQVTYGPSGASFTASFGGPVSIHLVDGVTYYVSGPVAAKPGVQTDAVIVVGPRAATGPTCPSEAAIASASKSGLAATYACQDGLVFTTPKTRCPSGGRPICQAIALVETSRAEYLVRSFGPSADAVETFLASFSPAR